VRPKVHEVIFIVEDDDEVRAYAARVLRQLATTSFISLNAVDVWQTSRTALQPFIHRYWPARDGPAASSQRLARRCQPLAQSAVHDRVRRNAIVHNGTLDSDVDMLPKTFNSETLARRMRQSSTGDRLSGPKANMSVLLIGPALVWPARSSAGGAADRCGEAAFSETASGWADLGDSCSGFGVDRRPRSAGLPTRRRNLEAQ